MFNVHNSSKFKDKDTFFYSYFIDSITKAKKKPINFNINVKRKKSARWTSVYSLNCEGKKYFLTTWMPFESIVPFKVAILKTVTENICKVFPKVR